jgi:Twin arginine targeting (Tat) protein translocase TatC
MISDTDSQQTFISHLIELRDRLIRALIAVGILFVALFLWPGSAAIYDLLAAPLMKALPEGSKMIATGVVTPFLVPMKVTGLVAFVLALPYVLYQVWAFIAPGLYSHEKKFGLPLVVASTLLFLLGMAFCYFFVFGKVFAFINEFAPKSITPAPDIENYLSFVMTMFLAFGLTFEIPVVVVVLARMGMVTVAQLREARPYVIVGAFVVAAVVTPPDVLSQLLLAIPMCLLYELGVWVASLMAKPASDEEDYHPLSDEEMERELDTIEAEQKKPD